MLLTKEFFKKLILFSIGLTIIEAGLAFLPIFSSYEILEDQLHQGYLTELVNFEVRLAIYLLLIISNFTGLFLLYQFNPIGRSIYFISYIAMIIVLMLDADFVTYSLLIPLESFSGFLEIFILYVIYLSPLKKELSSP